MLFAVAGYTLGVSYPALDDAARAAAADEAPPPPPTGGYTPSWPFVIGAWITHGPRALSVTQRALRVTQRS
jgi:hypothetical protein